MKSSPGAAGRGADAGDGVGPLRRPRGEEIRRGFGGFQGFDFGIFGVFWVFVGFFFWAFGWFVGVLLGVLGGFGGVFAGFGLQGFWVFVWCS